MMTSARVGVFSALFYTGNQHYQNKFKGNQVVPNNKYINDYDVGGVKDEQPKYYSTFLTGQPTKHSSMLMLGISNNSLLKLNMSLQHSQIQRKEDPGYVPKYNGNSGVLPPDQETRTSNSWSSLTATLYAIKRICTWQQPN